MIEMYRNINEFETRLLNYQQQFEHLYNTIQQGERALNDLESLIDEYSDYILDEQPTKQYEHWRAHTSEHRPLIKSLADITARCVKLMEATRAQRLIHGQGSTTGYFDNIEHCISEEFGQFKITPNDTVLLVGSGAYPMTLVQIAQETGARVIGIDIDEEAVRYGQQVINILAPDAPIEIHQKTVSELEVIRDVTHVIFSSTVEMKYDILEELYESTDHNIVVSMRYGDGLKSIFNYPKQATHPKQWTCVADITRPDQIFDIALYQKGSEGRA
ncbi:TPA: staphylopine biosynthesis enzyme CntL [Staphylococcus delphini]|nr:staphylopine biosynthesis enzyme CntL [Staphylococcus delphini]HEC2148920.1 staphylopine biosynthesis enzyme CntL [Staphylococcus delphini]HEC2151039.1 staphylopine biosynthesis enzyme CntL [Staphylococcus delphini]HEC2161030.1 staphylopine biosynthesis enzyme CntL [Staphylococcus delphini]HEC2169093.1 staphylopine biosynthesis enzyme CntL [Staphylococcus delphini]